MAKGTRGGKRAGGAAVAEKKSPAKKLSIKANMLKSEIKTKVLAKETAKVEKAGKKYGETRGHVKIRNVKVPKDGEYKHMDKKTYSIMEETGVDTETAHRYMSVVRQYTLSPPDSSGLSFTDRVANGTDKASINTLNEMMSKMGTFNGEIYRGMHLSAADANKFMKNIKPGKEIKMRGVSSWTSDSKIADVFANKGVNAGRAQTQVVFRSKNNKSGVGIEHLSSALLGGKSEAEVLMPSTAKFKISKVTEVSSPRPGVKKYIVDVDET